MKFFKFRNPNSTRGLTLIELVIVMAIVIILATAGFLQLTEVRDRKALENDAQKIVFTLRNARDKSITAEQSSQWGVHFDNTTSTGPSFELFSGSSYPGNTIMKTPLSANIQFASPSLGVSTTILFSQITGLASASATIIISLSDDGTVYKTINIPANASDISY